MSPTPSPFDLLIQSLSKEWNDPSLSPTILQTSKQLILLWESFDFTVTDPLAPNLAILHALLIATFDHLSSEQKAHVSRASDFINAAQAAGLSLSDVVYSLQVFGVVKGDPNDITV